MRKYIIGIILIFALFEYLFNEDSSVDRNDGERNVKKLEEIVFHMVYLHLVMMQEYLMNLKYLLI